MYCMQIVTATHPGVSQLHPDEDDAVLLPLVQVAGEEAVQGARSAGDGGVGVDEHDADDDGRGGRHDAHDLGKNAVSGSAFDFCSLIQN